MKQHESGRRLDSLRGKENRMTEKQEEAKHEHTNAGHFHHIEVVVYSHRHNDRCIIHHDGGRSILNGDPLRWKDRLSARLGNEL
jgi:hypothetical protein